MQFPTLMYLSLISPPSDFQSPQGYDNAMVNVSQH
nr:MAG TPA: hypothetical protein [Bacteriophage sp.]DAQ85567.1 MAG TPA: hypothetical protein [Caudoviricetes sp.]